MRKFAASFLLSLALVVGGTTTANAQTTASIQAQINILLQQIAALTAQINALHIQNQNSVSTAATSPTTDTELWGQPSTSEASSVCTIDRTLSTGMTGDDVRALQIFLTHEGVYTAAITGYFGPRTEAAVMAWQSKQGIEATGVFGAISRARVKERCGGTMNYTTGSSFSATPSSGSAPLAVTFKNTLAGAPRPAGYAYNIEFGDGTSESAANCVVNGDTCGAPGLNYHAYSAAGTYTARLIRTPSVAGANGGCVTNANGQTTCTVSNEGSLSSALVATATIVVGGGTVTGGTGCMSGGVTYPEGTTKTSIINSDGTTSFVSDGQYTCRSGSWEISGSLPIPDGSTVVCTTEYSPVCGQPSFSCPANSDCQRPIPRTYSNACQMRAANASFLYLGACTNGN